MTHRKTAIEEILDKHYQPRMHWAAVNRKNVLAAMEEHATEQVKISLDAMESFASQPEGREEKIIIQKKRFGYPAKVIGYEIEHTIWEGNPNAAGWDNVKEVKIIEIVESEDLGTAIIEKIGKPPYCNYYLKPIIALSLPPSKEQPAGVEERCGICGGQMVLIRGRYPAAMKRHTCPTCTTERLEQINEISAKEYGVAYKTER